MSGLMLPAHVLGQQNLGGAPFNPETSMTWKSLLWAEDSVTTKPSDGTDNRYWSDAFAGANYHDSSSNSSRWPTYRASHAAMNNRPALVFSADDGFGVTANFASALSPPFSAVYIGVAQVNNAGPLLTDSSIGEFHSSGMAIRNPTYRNSLVVPPDYTARHLYIWVTDGASSKVIIDNGSPTTIAAGSPGTNTATKFKVWGQYGGTGTPTSLAGLYPGDITADGQYSNFRAWAISHYGIV